MKHIITLPLLAASLILMAGCSTPTHVDSGTIHARTFSFVDPGPRPTADFADNRQVVHTLIQDAITRNLAVKGVTRVDKGGEVTVGYLVIVGNNAVTTAINNYFGYGQDSSGLEEKAHKTYTSSKNPNHFEAGTLVVDIIDSGKFKLLKRNYATQPVMRNLTTEVRAARVQEVVDEILRDTKFTP